MGVILACGAWGGQDLQEWLLTLAMVVFGSPQAFSAFYFVMNFLNLTSDPLERVKEKLEHYCATPWTQVSQHTRALNTVFLTFRGSLGTCVMFGCVPAVLCEGKAGSSRYQGEVPG